MAKIKIAIDSGHGSNTAGKRTPKILKLLGLYKKGTQIHEHWVTAKVCAKLEKKLKKLGYDTFKSAWNDDVATDDKDVTLTTRQNAIKKAKCDYSISVHLNACGDGIKFNSGSGAEVLIHNNSAKVGDSKEMAEYVLKELVKGTKQTNRGVKGQELAMCNCPRLGTKAAILVELAFMTNLKEVETMITNETFLDECAKEIADGIHAYIMAIDKK